MVSSKKFLSIISGKSVFTNVVIVIFFVVDQNNI